ncbi:hypothetical protein ACFWH1_18590 [Streptomyces sp. NPDC127037]|uniref:hypothetical protein n=1 Tax=Streptomyces sp. NPDC127037 TaxID=3347113 RepID=UPI003646F3C0
MYEITVEAPGITARTYHCANPGEMRDVVWGVARAAGEPIPDARNGEMVHTVGALRSSADTGETATLAVAGCTLNVEAYDPTDFECEGHESLYAGLGETVYCDGACRPLEKFNLDALIDLGIALDDAALDESGGCGACGLEAGQMCAGCGRCNCDRHDTCERPAFEPA